jgi:sporulation protein YlmC with PRC-barrel domain
MNSMLKTGIALAALMVAQPSLGLADDALPASVKNVDGSINASNLVGLKVENGDGDVVGKVGEVVLEKDGNVEGVVVDVGGFLGIGVHPVLLNWHDLQLNGSQGEVKALVNATKARLKALPAYEP